MLLEIKDLTKNFGGLAAVDRFDLNVNKGEIVGLIGPNGAGKSTVFNLITGIYPSSQGRILFDGRDITGKKPHEVAALGIGRTTLDPFLSATLTLFVWKKRSNLVRRMVLTV
jgi:branched-chain amino acid transport system ATP-binding protein